MTSFVAPELAGGAIKAVKEEEEEEEGAVAVAVEVIIGLGLCFGLAKGHGGLTPTAPPPPAA